MAHVWRVHICDEPRCSNLADNKYRAPDEDRPRRTNRPRPLMVSVGVLSRSTLPSCSMRDDKGRQARAVLERRDLHSGNDQRLFGRAVSRLHRYGRQISLSLLCLPSQTEAGIATEQNPRILAQRTSAHDAAEKEKPQARLEGGLSAWGLLSAAGHCRGLNSVWIVSGSCRPRACRQRLP
jgi:hypothetical protein